MEDYYDYDQDENSFSENESDTYVPSSFMNEYLKEDKLTADSDDHGFGLCFSCLSPIVPSLEYYVCSSCGKTQDSIVENVEEKGIYTDDFGKQNDSRRTNKENSLVKNSSLSTTVKSKGKLSRIMHIVAGFKGEDKNLIEIQKVYQSLGILENVIDIAVENYRKVFSIKLKEKKIMFRQGTRRGLEAACLFDAYKKTGIEKTSKDIANIMGHDRKIVADGITLYNSLLTRHLQGHINTEETEILKNIKETCTNKLMTKDEEEQKVSDKHVTKIVNENKKKLAKEKAKQNITIHSVEGYFENIGSKVNIDYKYKEEYTAVYKKNKRKLSNMRSSSISVGILYYLYEKDGEMLPPNFFEIVGVTKNTALKVSKIISTH